MTYRIRAATAAVAAAMVVSAGLLAGGGTSQAAMDVKEAIEARQKAMKENTQHMKAINAYLESGQGEPSVVAEHATAIAEIAKGIPTVFPQGSSLADNHGVKTAAKPEIWTDWSAFEAQAAALGEKANALAQAASGGDKEAIAAAFGDLGKNGCVGCHSKFRQEQS
jgi:cytochrome c556